MRWVLGLVAASALYAATPAEEGAEVLKQNCTSCHGAALKMSGLDLRTRESVLAGGERGAAVVPGDAGKSRLYRLAAGLENPSMPPGKSLSAEQLAKLKRWIEAGAPLDVTPSAPATVEASAAEKAALAKMEERPITEAERKFWSFVPPSRPLVPSGYSNPIDAFLRSALQSKGLKASGPASRPALIRRAYLDVIGLPPTPAQVAAFVKDASPNAFSKVVEQLLASPHYGERWGRHWLDVVRFSDSGGFEYDRDRPNAWRYRDYVVNAFNSDKPYDRFLREQLAGDEIWPESAEARVATGYLRLGPENNLKNEQTRLDELDDLVSTTSNAFLGLTVQCARCHNHKFDPIAQKDYYRMQAVFFPIKAYDHPLVDAEAVKHFEDEQKRIGDLQAPWKQKVKDLEAPYREKLLAAKKAKLADYIQVALRTPAEQRTEGQKLNAAQVEKTLSVEAEDVLAALTDEDRSRHAELDKEIALLEKLRPEPFAAAMSIAEPGRVAPDAHFLHRGSPGQKGSVVQPGVIAVADRSGFAFPAAPEDAKTSWRRRAFADWVASKENPLTARVMVNRVWQQHFGEGLVRTPNNFGKMGERPTHPELLDYLAVEFMANGWSVKDLQRKILNSETYQMASDDIAANRAVDPDNRLLWRMPRRRLEGEAIRDSLFAVAGNLDLTVGGPAVHPYIDPALYQASSKRTWVGKSDSDPSTWRRSVYVFSKRSIPLPMLDVFDKPDSITSCARRNRSTIAPQALILMNNALVLQEAGIFAKRLEREAGAEPERQVHLAFHLALSRPPSKQEMVESLEFLRTPGNALVDFCQVMMNLNEFVYIP